MNNESGYVDVMYYACAMWAFITEAVAGWVVLAWFLMIANVT